MRHARVVKRDLSVLERRDCKLVYGALVKYMELVGYPPTQKDISKMTSISTYRCTNALKDLSNAGLIKKKPKTARGITLVGYKYIRV